VVTAVDPDHGGEIVWQKRVGNGSTLGGVKWGVAADESKLYVAVSDPNSIPRDRQLLARKLLFPIKASRCSSIARRAEDFGPLNSKPGKKSG
jgi:hypothetical protein